MAGSCEHSGGACYWQDVVPPLQSHHVAAKLDAKERSLRHPIPYGAGCIYSLCDSYEEKTLEALDNMLGTVDEEDNTVLPLR